MGNGHSSPTHSHTAFVLRPSIDDTPMSPTDRTETVEDSHAVDSLLDSSGHVQDVAAVRHDRLVESPAHGHQLAFEGSPVGSPHVRALHIQVPAALHGHRGGSLDSETISPDTPTTPRVLRRAIRAGGRSSSDDGEDGEYDRERHHGSHLAQALGHAFFDAVHRLLGADIETDRPTRQEPDDRVERERDCADLSDHGSESR